MRTVANAKIDLSNYAPEDLEFSYPRGSQLTIELDKANSIEVQGHNALSDVFYTLPIIKVSSYDILTKIQDAGVYNIDITSVDKVKLVTSGNEGMVYIKVIGD